MKFRGSVDIMIRKLPKKPRSMDEIYKMLEEYSSNDIRAENGRLFTYLYDSGIDDLKKLSDIFVRFLNSNGMDYHAFPSTLKMENDVVAMISSMLNGDEEVAGNFTTGGTESIILAVKSARDLFREKKGNRAAEPEMIIPTTAHPAFRKAAEYLGMKAVRVPVDPNSFLASPEKARDAITDNTAIIVSSAPSFPYGGIDPIEDLGKIAAANGIWLHVDACVGGFILPFLRKLGVPIKKFDFEVDGVSSISVDLHKYGYTPKGSSVILYRNKSLRKHQLYVNASWPGYPMSNVGIQSTKSAGPLAASWAVLHFLGEEGYVNLARKSLHAKEMISEGVEKLGFYVVGKPEATIFAFTRDDINMFAIGSKLRDKGWFLQIQPGSAELGMPPSLHLNANPVHEKIAENFLRALEKVTKESKSSKRENPEELLKRLGIDPNGPNFKKSKVVELLTSPQSPVKKDRTLLYELIRHMPSEVIEEAFKDMVNEDFSPTLE